MADIKTMLVTNDDGLKELCRGWASVPWVAVDTEFVREQTYYPRLCLIQVSNGDEPAVVDMLAIRDPDPLFTLLERRDIIKVFHSASQDLELFVHLRGQVPQPIFDTQIAATLLGDGDQLGYAALVQRRLGVSLDKSLTRSDWSRRPLHAQAIDYAAEDVRHLAVLYPLLERELDSRDRRTWLREECARATDPGQYRTAPEEAWKRLRGLSRLPTSAAQSAAVALAAWREREAMRANRPRRWILSDDALYSISVQRPQTVEGLKQVGMLSPKSLSRYGAALLQALIGSGAAHFKTNYAEPLKPDQKAFLHDLRGCLDDASRRLEIPASFLATRAELEHIARQDCAAADSRLFHGWRRQAMPEMLRLIERVHPRGAALTQATQGTTGDPADCHD